MSLIFDRFPSTDKAEAFVDAVYRRFSLGGQVFASREDSYEHDPFPGELDPPIAHIDRPELDSAATEEEVEQLVEEFGGAFAGT